MAERLHAAADVESHWEKERQRGRNEKRHYQALHLKEVSLNTQDRQLLSDWKKLRSFVRVERWRTTKDESSHEVSYYISDLEVSAPEFARGIRGHWSIENQLHCVKDRFFREDDHRLLSNQASKNFALLCSMVISILYRTGYGKNFKERTRYYINRVDRLWKCLALPPPQGAD